MKSIIMDNGAIYDWAMEHDSYHLIDSCRTDLADVRRV